MGARNDTIGPPTNHWETDCDFSGGCFAAQMLRGSFMWFFFWCMKFVSVSCTGIILTMLIRGVELRGI